MDRIIAASLLAENTVHLSRRIDAAGVVTIASGRDTAPGLTGEGSPPARFSLANPPHRASTGRRAESSVRGSSSRREGLVAARSVARISLGGLGKGVTLGRGLSVLLALGATPLTIAARLRAPVLLPLLRGSILLLAPSASPTVRGEPTRWRAIPRTGVGRVKPLLATLQQAPPPSRHSLTADRSVTPGPDWTRG
jgi:hypothetical protein